MEGGYASGEGVSNYSIAKQQDNLKNITVKEKIGGGHFGEVFQGIWLENTTVALKRITGVNLLEEFENELSILK